MSALPLIATEIADIEGFGSGAERFCSAPASSNVDLLRNGERIIHIDAEVPDSALDLGVAEQKLHGSQIPGASVDERRLGSPQ